MKRSWARSFILSISSGILLSLAWPPLGFPLIAMTGFIPLLFLARDFLESQVKHKGRKIFGWSFLSFFIWNLGTTWWIYNSSGGGSLLAFVFNSIFMAITFTLFFKGLIRSGGFAWFLFPVSWLSFEYLHIVWDLSWPWLTLGNVFSGYPVLVQWYEWTGVLGGSAWVLIINLLLFISFGKGILSGLKGLKEATPVLLFLAIPMLVSFVLIPDKNLDKGCHVVIVQPNVDPYEDKFSGTAQEQMEAMLRLSEPLIKPETRFVFLPETAVPDGVSENEPEANPCIQLIRSFQKAYPGIHVITGVSSYRDFGPDVPRTPAARSYKKDHGFWESYNSGLWLGTNHELEIYHKSKLVIGVEKIPYPSIFGMFEEYALDMGGTTGTLGTQLERTVFQTPEGAIAPVICYESVYGAFLSGFIEHGAGLFAILTNDGWWGDTPGYKQHMLYGTLRAIEFRREIVRSANTGISCIIRKDGSIEQPTGYWVPAAIDGIVHFENAKTFYAITGDWPGWLAWSVLMGWGIFQFIPRRIFPKNGD